MAQDSKIGWTHHTANLVWGCTKVHEGCDNCYAEILSHRFNDDIWGNDKPRKMIKSVWKDFAKYQRLAKEANEIHRVFVGSMMDIFEKPMPLINSKGEKIENLTTGDLRNKFFNEVIPDSPNLLFLLLTKRPSNINKYIPESWKESPPSNVMFGTSPVNQVTAEKLIKQLSKVKGHKFISIEPQLDEVNLLTTHMYPNPAGEGQISAYLIDHVDWVIVGGESGSNKRPYNTDWGRKIKSDCEKTGTAFFFKQIDKVQEIPEDLMIREFPYYIDRYLEYKNSLF